MQQYLCKVHWKYEIYNISLWSKEMWKHINSEWRQIPAKRTKNRPLTPDSIISPNAHYARHCFVVYIYCYRSCHNQKLISILSALHEWRTRTVKVKDISHHIRSRLYCPLPFSWGAFNKHSDCGSWFFSHFRVTGCNYTVIFLLFQDLGPYGGTVL